MKNISVTATTYPQHKDITLLSVKGFIDTNTAPEFDKTFQSILNEKKYNVIIDLKEVNYISSAGWGIFVGEIKRIRGQKGNLFLASMSPEVMEAYELLQFNTIIKSFPDVDQAVQKGFGKPIAKKSVASPAMEASPSSGQQESRVENSRTVGMNQPQAGMASNKPGFFGRLFKPWKWF
jgi:anti-sigma B factor antagonist